MTSKTRSSVALCSPVCQGKCAFTSSNTTQDIVLEVAERRMDGRTDGQQQARTNI